MIKRELVFKILSPKVGLSVEGLKNEYAAWKENNPVRLFYTVFSNRA